MTSTISDDKLYLTKLTELIMFFCTEIPPVLRRIAQNNDGIVEQNAVIQDLIDAMVTFHETYEVQD